MGKMSDPQAQGQLLITLRRSPIGTPERSRKVLQGLGLRRTLQTVRRPDSPQVRGLINKVKHLLDVVAE